MHKFRKKTSIFPAKFSDVRPRLKYCIQAWSPYLSIDIEVLERVQKAATDLVPQLRKYNYADRLKVLGLTSLKERRERGDMIEVYKILTGKEHIDSGQFFTLADNHYCLRGHDMKLTKERSRLYFGSTHSVIE